MMRPRARALGLPFPGTPGPLNAITDVAGLAVGMCTLTDPERHIRTGVTAILPRPEHEAMPVWAGLHVLNGNGEMTGTHWVQDAGYFLGPVMITSTHGVGAVHTGTTRWMIDHYHAHFHGEHHAWAMPVVAETYDGVLSDINAMAITSEHAVAALEARSTGPVAEGATGGGNGMIAYEFKAGTGTASRLVTVQSETFTIGALVQANHGIRDWLTVLGRPIGRQMQEGKFRTQETGSIVVILATDAPLSGQALRHLARRATMGVARGGTPGGNNSGDIFLALSTANPAPMPQVAPAFSVWRELSMEHLDSLYLAAAEAVEEAVVNAIVAGEDTPTFHPAGNICHGIDRMRLAEIFAGGSQEAGAI